MFIQELFKILAQVVLPRSVLGLVRVLTQLGATGVKRGALKEGQGKKTKNKQYRPPSPRHYVYLQQEET